MKRSILDLKSIIKPLSFFNPSYCLFKKKYSIERTRFNFLLPAYYYCEENFYFTYLNIAANSGLQTSHASDCLHSLLDDGYIERYYSPRAHLVPKTTEFRKILKPNKRKLLYKVNQRGMDAIHHFMRCYDKISRES